MSEKTTAMCNICKESLKDEDPIRIVDFMRDHVNCEAIE